MTGTKLEEWRKLADHYEASDEFGYSKAFYQTLREACNYIDALEAQIQPMTNIPSRDFGGPDMNRIHVADHSIPRGWWTPELERELSAIPAETWAESVLAPRDVLNALRHFRPVDTRVVILGQDPYPKPGKANGLAFGVRCDWEGDRLQSSSGNVAREACRLRVGDSGISLSALSRHDWSLESWASQGVLLLNADLSVRPGEPGSHRGQWRGVVREVTRQLPESVVWLAWGRPAVDLAHREARASHLIIEATHPCRYSAGRSTARLASFVGSNPFGSANFYLRQMGWPPIKWAQPAPGGHT